SHESQELSCWSPGRWLLRRNVHAHDESWERASGPKSSAICRSVSSTSPQSREGHGDIEGRDAEIGRAQGRGNRSDGRQDDSGLIFWLNQGEQRLHDCRQGQGAGGTATLFVKSGDDYVRISTNVPGSVDGRALGTILDPKGKAIVNINKGEPFYGEVDILGKPYVTGYDPIKDASGKVIGIRYVGYEK